jgi:hypothetical protein
MESWNIFDPVELAPKGEISIAFICSGSRDYRAAAQFVSRLPYRRNSDVRDSLVVMREGCGTCSTKHALLSRLAMEQGLGLTLVVGIYEMSGDNTPGIGRVLGEHRLKSLSEAHCYLRYRGRRVDVTWGNGRVRDLKFLLEEDILPEQIGEHKAALHRQYMRRWMADSNAPGLDLDNLWRIREECIAALSQ